MESNKIKKPCCYCDYYTTDGKCMLELPHALVSCYTPSIIRRMDKEKSDNEKQEIIYKKEKGISNIQLMKEYHLEYPQLRVILDKAQKEKK